MSKTIATQPMNLKTGILLFFVVNPMALLTNQYTFISFRITRREKLQINKYKLHNQGLYKYCYQKSY